MRKDTIKILNDGLIASAIINSFEKRYPSMKLTELSPEEFEKKMDDKKFFIEYITRLHRYQAGFKDCLKFQKNLRNVQISSVREGEHQEKED